jgi:hypothetical protein
MSCQHTACSETLVAALSTTKPLVVGVFMNQAVEEVKVLGACLVPTAGTTFFFLKQDTVLLLTEAIWWQRRVDAG